MKIIIHPHTLERAEERGTCKDEIIDVLHSGFDISAKGQRKGKAKVFNYQKRRLGTFYKHKRVDVIYAVEDDTIITITVYVFYGFWEGTYESKV